MEENENNGRYRSQKHAKAAGPEQIYRGRAAPQLANYITTNHGADAQSETCDGAQGR